MHESASLRFLRQDLARSGCIFNGQLFFHLFHLFLSRHICPTHPFDPPHLQGWKFRLICMHHHHQPPPPPPPPWAGRPLSIAANRFDLHYGPSTPSPFSLQDFQSPSLYLSACADELMSSQLLPRTLSHMASQVASDVPCSSRHSWTAKYSTAGK